MTYEYGWGEERKRELIRMEQNKTGQLRGKERKREAIPRIVSKFSGFI